MPTKAAAQIGVSFGRQDLDVLAVLDEYCAATGANRSEVVRRAVRAAMLGDEDLQRAFDSFRKMKGFTGAARRVAREVMAPAVAAG